MLRQWYAGWLLKGVDVVDRLALWPPVSAPDDAAAFARELYHRYLGHLLAVRLWRLEWLALLAATVLLLVMHPIVGYAPVGLAPVFGILGIVAAVVFGARMALRFLLAPPRIRVEIEAAKALVRRICLREVPENAPSDLADPWRYNWMTADGRPIAAEIGEFDLRSTELVGRCRPVFFSAVAFGLVAAGFSVAGRMGLLLIFLIVIGKMVRDPSPVATRSRLLDAAAAGTAEGAAWAIAGASRWSERLEEARRRNWRLRSRTGRRC
jgi:hypothetical protein